MPRRPLPFGSDTLEVPAYFAKGSGADDPGLEAWKREHPDWFVAGTWMPAPRRRRPKPPASDGRKHLSMAEVAELAAFDALTLDPTTLSIADFQRIGSEARVDAAKESVVRVDASRSARTQPVPYNPLGIFQPGSPENEEWARDTERGIGAVGRELGRIFHSEQQPPEGDGAQNEPAPSSLAKPGVATLPEDRRRYILDGDGRDGGGHGPGRSTPDKSNFPSDWSDEQAVEAITEVANDPASTRIPSFKGRTRVLGTRNGVDIEVVVGADGKTIITGYPTNTPRGSK